MWLCSGGSKSLRAQPGAIIIMNAKNGIKIVKRSELISESRREAARPVAESQPNVTRTVTRQVASWVKEFQQRRVQERGRSFESLFQRA
jgi:hypothetical protein